MQGYVWAYSLKAQKVPEGLKKEIEIKSDKIIAELKKKYIKKPPKNPKFNYIADIYYRWIQRRFYFCSKYNCPPDAISESFENKFARLEYTGKNFNGKDKFQLFFMRHTGQWIKLLEDKSLDSGLKSIEEDPWFAP